MIQQTVPDNPVALATPLLFFQKLLWDLFWIGGIFTSICCLTLHRAGLNEWTDPISIEFANGNGLAILFFSGTLFVLSITGYLYRLNKRIIEPLLILCAIVAMSLVVVSKPHSSFHICAYYSTVIFSIATPLFSFFANKRWIPWSVVILFAVIILSGSMVSATFFPEFSTLGITQRIWFFLCFLSNLWALWVCVDNGKSRIYHP